MNAHDFVSEQEYETIKKLALSHKQVNYKKTVDKCSFCFDSSHARWEDKSTKYGDYILLYQCSRGYGDYAGGGGPLIDPKFQKILSSYDNLVHFIDEHMNYYAKDKYTISEKIQIGELTYAVNEKEQMSFF